MRTSRIPFCGISAYRFHKIQTVNLEEHLLASKQGFSLKDFSLVCPNQAAAFPLEMSIFFSLRPIVKPVPKQIIGARELLPGERVMSTVWNMFQISKKIVIGRFLFFFFWEFKVDIILVSPNVCEQCSMQTNRRILLYPFEEQTISAFVGTLCFTSSNLESPGIKF